MSSEPKKVICIGKHTPIVIVPPASRGLDFNCLIADEALHLEKMNHMSDAFDMLIQSVRERKIGKPISNEFTKSWIDYFDNLDYEHKYTPILNTSAFKSHLLSELEAINSRAQQHLGLQDFTNLVKTFANKPFTASNKIDIIVNDWLCYSKENKQFRFPKTKKKRIQKKWAKRLQNFRMTDVHKAYYMESKKIMYVSSKLYEELRNA